MGSHEPSVGGELPGTPVDRHVGANLRTQRLANGLSVKTIAQALAVPEADVAQWEDGLYRVPAHHLLAISHLLSCPLSTFFDGLPAKVPLEDDIERTETQVSLLFHRFSGAKH
jgi:transcriptional regulator with XRE-family HTH domain